MCDRVETANAKGLQQWADGLRYLDGELWDADGHAVVVPFDKAEITKAVEDLGLHEGCCVLEVGFGLGFSADAIQRSKPSSHVIVECAPAVLNRLKAWASERPNVTVVEGTWQAVLSLVGKFDRIFFDGSRDVQMNVSEMERCQNGEHRAAYLDGISGPDTSVFAAFERAARMFHCNSGARVLSANGSEFRQWADGFFFSTDADGNEQLLDCDGSQIMMKWEKPYMEECVADLAIDGTCDVLEVGFGCGYSAERIQQEKPRSHTIIECSEPVLERLRAWAAVRPNVRVVEGTWQSRLPDLGLFDRIFFDDWGEPGLADREMTLCTRQDYRDQYDCAFDHENGSHFEGFVRIAMTCHARKGTRLSGFMMRRVEDLTDIGVSSEYRYTSVEPPSHCNYFFSNRALVPLFVKSSPPSARHGHHTHHHDDDGGSTRSGSLCSSRSRGGRSSERCRSRSRSRGREPSLEHGVAA